MGSIGMGELLLIFLVAYFILGPEKFPGIVKKAGKELSRIVKFREELQDSLLNENSEENDK